MGLSLGDGKSALSARLSAGQRIADFSQCGYRGGTEPLPNVSALIPQNRWVYVSPGAGDDTALIQAAIDSVEAMTPDANGWRGVVYLNAGSISSPPPSPSMPAAWC